MFCFCINLLVGVPFRCPSQCMIFSVSFHVKYNPELIRSEISKAFDNHISRQLEFNRDNISKLRVTIISIRILKVSRFSTPA